MVTSSCPSSILEAMLSTNSNVNIMNLNVIVFPNEECDLSFNMESPTKV